MVLVMAMVLGSIQVRLLDVGTEARSVDQARNDVAILVTW
jgi:hypothetical protein